ncbi:uncharacterized protein LOC106090257 [Stomoxys calcitrans]|uniref:uncharacterized protein LOC106090257 n=1 Tax=Stomoxys calcitrans TaxID=35570 RepID=UPI0027E23111|nr:uncharacterized protein LOC106090257 [Stomoxys calcitrans]
MKLIYIVIYFLIPLYSGEKSGAIEELQNLVTNCLQKYPVSDDELARFRELDKDPSLASDNYKCFGMCVVQGRGWFIDDVLIDDAYIKFDASGVLEEHVDELYHIIKECKLLVGENKCDTVFQVGSCLEQKSWELLEKSVKSF